MQFIGRNRFANSITHLFLSRDSPTIKFLNSDKRNRYYNILQDKRVKSWPNTGRKELSPKKIESPPDFRKDHKIERCLKDNPTFSALLHQRFIVFLPTKWITKTSLLKKIGILSLMKYFNTEYFQNQVIFDLTELPYTISAKKSSMCDIFKRRNQQFSFALKINSILCLIRLTHLI